MPTLDDGHVAVADAALVRRVVARLPPRDLLALAARWDPAGHAAVARTVGARDKKGVVKAVLDTVLKSRLTYRQLAQIDLTYARNAGIKRWKTLKLGYGDRRPPTVDVLYVVQRFNEVLTSFFTVHAFGTLLDDALWLRLAFYDNGAKAGGLPSAANVTIMVYYPHTQYLLTTAIKSVYREFVQQALLRAFDCESVDDVELKGRNAAALGDLLVHQQSQGPWSHYRLNDVDPNPLDRKRRRVAADAGAAPGLKLTAASGTLVEEDHERRRALDRTVRAQFGDNALPALDNVRIDLQTTWTGRWSVGVVPCVVRLEGSNVLEGLRELIPKGATIGRLPKFLETLPERASSHIVVTDDDIAVAEL